MIQRVMVALDKTQDSRTSWEYLADLYLHHSVTIEAVAFLDFDGVENFLHNPYQPRDEKPRELHRDQARKMQDVKADFDLFCAQQNITHTDYLVQEGAIDYMTENAGYFDLVVMGMASCKPMQSENPFRTIWDIIHNTSCPVLGTPEKYQPIKRAALCFDGSIPSIRTMKSFAQLSLFELEELTLLYAKDKRKGQVQHLEKALRYLQAHGLKPQLQVLSGNAQQTIPTYLEKEPIDLVALGPHTGTLKSLLFGSLTNTLLTKQQTPLFLG